MEAKIKTENRRLNQKARVLNLYLLSNAFVEFQGIKMNAQIVANKDSFEGAENMSLLVNTFFNGDTTPADFLHDDSVYENKAIEHHAKFKQYCVAYESCTGRPAEEMEAFCNTVFYSKCSLRYLIDFQNFSRHMANTWLYVANEISSEVYENLMIDFTPVGSRPTSYKDIRYYIIDTEEVIKDIMQKRDIRALKKNKVL